MIAGNTVQLNAMGNHIVQYAWKPAESLSCGDCQDPEASPKNTTTYAVVAFTDKGCSDSDRVTIYVICEQSQVYIPNTFTPNGDGQNDRFYPRGRGIRTIKSFKIYDRWGEVIFDRSNIDVNDQNQGWDGTFKGADLSPDVYVYTIDGICDTGEEFSWQGDISLIR
jgi:gliding motility-associated-like protein